jgi:hypothetical protein
MNLIPVNPLITDAGDLVSLASLRGTLRAQPVPLDPGSTAQNVVVSTQQLDIGIAAKVGVGSIFAGSVQANESGYWLDAMAFADSGFSPTAGNIVSQTRWGFGLRIMFRARLLDTSIKLSFAVLGAAVELGLADASYEVQTIGLGPLALAAVLDGLSQFGTLRGDTFHDLNTTVISNLKQLITDHEDELTPRPIAVLLSIPVELDPVVKAHTEVFAMRRLRDRMSLHDALARANGHYDGTVIRTVYGKVAPGIQDTDTPPTSARDFAKQWLG